MSDSQVPRAQAREFMGVRPRFAFWVGMVVLLAFLIREYFILVAVVDIPIRGDIREYVVYAWNLFHHGVFSVAPPQAAMPVPDAYRSPGYPWLLALCMFLRPGGDGWFALALQMQVILGTATIWLTMLLARRWMPQGWAIAAGLILAVWPHHVAATGALLSEVAFGFALMAGLFCLAKGVESRRSGFLALAALVFGYAYLINPLIALFPPIMALLAWRERGGRAAMLFTGVFLVPLLAWGLRNAQLDTKGSSEGAGRATINVVQGSWPQYHQAWQAQRFGDPIGTAISREIDMEIKLLEDDPRAGISKITTRLANDPGYYAAWYLWRKPLLLWDWDIQVGAGGFYVLDVKNSPLDTHPLLRWNSAILRFLNPLLSLLALGGAVVLLAGGLRGKPWAPAAALAASALLLYLTAIHTAFQAEPRYANAYRGVEVLLIVTLLKLLVESVLHRKARLAMSVVPGGR